MGLLKLFGRDVLSQVPNLLVKHKLELFELLCLLLVMQDVLLPLVDCVVLDVDLRLLLGPLEVQLLNYFLLLVQRDVSIEDLAVESLDLRLYIGQLVLPDLQVSLRPQTHLGHLGQGSQILLLDLENFGPGILLDLCHSLIVVPLHGLNIFPQVSNLLILLRNVSLVLLLHLVDLLGMVFKNCGLCIAELPRFLLLLLLKCLVAGCILEHALRVLVPVSLQLLVILFLLHLELLEEVFLDLILARLQIFGPASDLELLGRKLLM